MTFKGMLRRLVQRFFHIYGLRGNVKTGKHVEIGLGTYIWPPQEMTIGDYVRIGKNCTLEANGRIGNNVIMGNLVGFIGRSDFDYQMVGTPISKATGIRHPGFKGKSKDMKIIVEDDVWIGYGAILLTGVCIGRGAVISAGAMVTHDIPPYAVVAGMPARVVGSRFTPEQIIEHETALYGRVITIE